MAKSNQAQVAKICKQYINSLGYPCAARSRSFSMGDSVDVSVENVPADILDKIHSELAKYEYGHFDGMTDMYELSNMRDDIPQTKYLHIGCTYTDDIKQKAWQWLRDSWQDAAEGPENFKDAHNYRLGNQWADQAIWQLLSGKGAFREETKKFWDSVVPKKEPAQSVEGAHIEKHEHTKLGIDMYLVLPESRLEPEQFNALRSMATAMGGWYSRKWGNTPGGFAFKSKQLAEEFLLQVLPKHAA